MAEILAGPALRHADVQGVNIWLVLDTKPNEVDLHVYDADRQQIGHADAVSLEPVKLGERLYFYLIKAISLQGAFNYDTRYYYDINIDGQGFEAHGLLTSARSIAYPGEHLPSFFLPKFHTNTIQSACRKPHAVAGGKNVFDKMSSIDTMLSDTISDLQSRVSRLLLTGDQIYADDVSSAMLVLVSRLATSLTGKNEEMPALIAGGAPVVPSQIKFGKRKELLNKKIGFTTGEGDHHLMSFGEYVVMYLLVWGGLSELIEYQEFDEVEDQFAKRGFFAKRKYNKALKVIKHFLGNAWRVRRIMANVPSYMIFDDHDVTDDWNLRENIAGLLNDTPLSRRLVSNALGAYWACQSWGNAPERFDDIKNPLSTWYGEHQPGADKALEDVLLNQFWGYVVPAAPAIVVLDTRTKRHLKGDELALMNDEAMQWLKYEMDLLAQYYEAKTVILVSATPVFGFTPIEMVQIGIFKKFPTLFDIEPWIANAESMQSLKNNLSRLKTVEHVLICSGDVHYAFHRLEKEPTQVEGRVLNYWQLTSSSACNIPLGKKGRSVFSSLDSALIGLQRLCLTALKWVVLKVLNKVAKNSQSVLSLMQYIEPRIVENAFSRKKTRYLVPEEEQNQEKVDFINADTNIGLVEVDEEGPIKSTLCFGNEGNEYAWTYDLRNPKEYLG